MARLERTRRRHDGAEREAEAATAAPSTVETEESPTADAFGDTQRRYYLAGLRNSDFVDPPEDTNSPIDGDGTNGNNPLPDWSFVRASGSAVDTWLIPDDPTSPSENHIAFAMSSGAAGDDGYLEQIVPVVSSARSSWAFWPCMTLITRATVDASEAYIFAEFLRKDGTPIIGTDSTNSIALNAIGAGQLTELYAQPGTTKAVPTAAYYLRVRIGYRRGALAAGTAGKGFDLYETRVSWLQSRAMVPDTLGASYEPSQMWGIGGVLYLRVPESGVMVLDSNGSAVESLLSIRSTAGQRSRLEVKVTGDSDSRARLYGDATAQLVEFGPGNTAPDVQLKRSAANTLQMPSGDTLDLSLATLKSLLLGYAEVTSSKASVTTISDWSGLSITVTVVSGHRIVLVAFTGGALSSVSNDEAALYIREGSTTLQSQFQPVGTTAQEAGLICVWSGTPGAGSHTYKVSVERHQGTGSLTFQAGATFPSLILAIDLGT